MRKAIALVMVVAPLAMAAELYNNGPVVTHPGQGFGGADVSMASSNANSGGANMLSPTYRCADDFTVPAGGWVLDGIKLSGYRTSAPPGNPGWTTFDLKIWAGANPGVGAPVYQTNAAPAIAFTNVYRIFNGVANLQNTDRALNSLTFALPNLNLAAGQYWFDLSVGGAATGWMNYVMDPNPANPNDPITRIGNAKQWTGASWVAPTYTPEFPFSVTGVPEPAALALLALGLLIRRR